MAQQALVLVNLGSPAAHSVSAVRRYLNQFLMDPYVIDLPWPLRRVLVSLIVARRAAASAHAYASVWWPEGAPLRVLSQRLQKEVQAFWPKGPVVLAMRYGEPSLAQVLGDLAKQGIEQLVLVPLYPQFADSTTTTVIEEAQRVIRSQRLSLRMTVLPPFYNQPEYLEALAASVQPYTGQGFDHLLMSYHGLPERHIRKADLTKQHCLRADQCCNDAEGVVLARCYRAQCVRTSQGLASRLGLKPAQWSFSFQSRLGRDRWIDPYTDERLDELRAQGVKRLLVVCPAFVTDCLETLEEIGDRARTQFLSQGGVEFQLIPCLNDRAQWARALASLAQRCVSEDESA